jgi:hypothetical protein
LQLFKAIFTDRFQKVLTRADDNSNILVLLSCGALLQTEDSNNYLQVFAKEQYVFRKMSPYLKGLTIFQKTF